MVVMELLSALAFRPAVDAALRFVEDKTGLTVGDRAKAVYEVLSDHLKDHSRKLGEMLEGANTRAWKTLEVALAGESLFTLLDRQEDKAFRRQIRAALDADPLNEVVGDDEPFRRRCLDQLREARRRGRLTTSGPLRPQGIFERASEFARFDEPKVLLDAEWRVVEEMAHILRDEYPDLARLLGRRETGRPPLLTVAVRYYFRRAVENDKALFKTLAMGSIESQGQEQERRYADLLRTVEDYGDRLAGLLEEVREIALKVHENVLDLRSEQQRQGEQLRKMYGEILALLERQDRLDGRALRPSDSFSIRSDQERRLVKAMIGRYRGLPERQRGELPALLNAVGKLEAAAGDFEQAQRDFQAVVPLVSDDAARAEAHHNAYLAALERRDYDTALQEIVRAVGLDAPRFAPFPMDKYSPVRILGAGGFGVAYLCRHQYMETLVVVKALLTEEIDRDIDRVFTEARLLGQLDHPRLIRVADCGYADVAGRARPYLVMDYFDGATLEQFVRPERRITLQELPSLARLAAEGLRAAHDRGILHRDVKPANLLVRKDESGWQVKVIDFGLALRRGLVEAASGGSTGAGRSIIGSSIAGTQGYAAPEQIGKLDGSMMGCHSDVYGFGRTLYYALFGVPDPDDEEKEGLPDGWRRFLSSCTARSVERRPADFTEVLNRLSRLDKEDRSVHQPPDLSLQDAPASSPVDPVPESARPSLPHADENSGSETASVRLKPMEEGPSKAVRLVRVASSPKRLASDPESFFEELGSNTGQAEVNVARKLVDWTSEVGLSPTFNKGAQVLSYIPTLICNSQFYYPISIRSTGKVHVQVQDLRSKTLFNEESKRLALLDLLNEIPGVKIERGKITGRPGIPLSLLVGEDALELLKEALIWMFDQIKAS